MTVFDWPVNHALKVNEYLKQNFDESFEISIGIHFGSVVLGNIGHHDKVQFTAIGDAVNVASRIEQQTKHVSTPILVSETMYFQINLLSHVETFGR